MSDTLFYAAPAELIANEYRFLPSRYQAESVEGLLDFIPENIRKALGGARRAIARVALRHFAWAFTRSKGGVRDEHGDWWVYKSARQLQHEYNKACMGVLDGDQLESTKTVERALLALVRLGVLIRKWVKIDASQGLGAAACYCYRPGPNWNEAVKDLKVSDGSDKMSGGSDTAVAQAETTSEKFKARGSERRSETDLCQNPGAVPFDRPDWTEGVCPEVPEQELFANDPTINSQQPEPALTTPTATPETPVAQPDIVGEDQGSAAAAEPVENPKTGLLAQIRHISGDLFRYMNKTYALAELLQRPSLRASGITEDDLDPLIGF